MKTLNLPLLAALISLPFLLGFYGCRKQDKNQESSIEVGGLTKETPNLNVKEIFKGRDEILFRSRKGKFNHDDSDVDIKLRSNGEIEVIEYMMAETDYHGIYSMGVGNTIDVKLTKYHGSWPQMIARSSEDGTFLFRSDGITAINQEAQDLEAFKDFWPFAEIKND